MSLSVWTRAAGAYNQYDPRLAPSWLDERQRVRAERIRQARLLHRGRHREYYLGEGRTQFDFPHMLAGGRRIQPYVTLNLLTLVVTKLTDLLCGETPAVRVEDDAAQERLDAILARSSAASLFHDVALAAAWAGEAWIEVVRRDGRAYLATGEPDDVHPLGVRRPDGQFDRYVRHATANVGTLSSPIVLLLTTTYSAGRIERRCEQLDGERRAAVSLDQWPQRLGDGSPLPEAEPTGLGRPSIVWVVNRLDGDVPVSDFDDLIPLQDELNAKQTQLARMFAKHADPKLYLPVAAADEQGNVRASDDAFYGDSPEAKPSYIEFAGSPAGAMADRDFVVSMFCLVAEMPASLLGIKADATAESARKLRLSASNALAKAARRAPRLAAAIALAMELAYALDARRPLGAPIDVAMRDGLPVDPTETAEEVATLRASGTISIRRALERQGLGPGALEREEAQLAAEAAAATPTTLMGEPAPSDVETPSEPDDADLAATPSPVEGSAPQAGVSTEVTLNGAQIDAAIQVIAQLQAGAIGPLTATELLVAVGIDRSRASAMVADSGARRGAETPSAAQAAEIN